MTSYIKLEHTYLKYPKSISLLSLLLGRNLIPLSIVEKSFVDGNRVTIPSEYLS